MALKSLQLLRSLSPDKRRQRKSPSIPSTPSGLGRSGARSISLESLGGARSSPARSLGHQRSGSHHNVNSTTPTSNGRSAGTRSSSSDGLEASGSGHSRSSSGEDNINVVVRVRPLNNREIQSNERNVVEFPGGGRVACIYPGQKPKVFSYNAVFEPAATQSDILQHCGITRLLQMAVEGFSCTAFCYGQTGSGKTHTLTGPPGLFGAKTSVSSDDHGLVVRSFVYLFQLLQKKKDVHFVLKASFLEIYNEKVIDLLNPGSARKPLAVRWSQKSRGFFVENLFMVDCEQLDDLFAVLEEGMKNRAMGSHRMNEHSSRSHTMLTVHIAAEQPAEGGVFISKKGKMNFVDLAGSEVTKKTHSQGKTLEEANNINKSLMVLGYCIASLSDNKRRSGHIPYRDSKLTKLLADSLAGDGVTLMIACISPSSSNINETINTLRYAARAKKIRTKPVIKMDPREALILRLKKEVEVLSNENNRLRSILLNQEEHAISPQLYNESIGKRLQQAPGNEVDLEKLAELEGKELAELVKLYMTENQALRQDNSELFMAREALMRDQELVCRENERLLKKLEDVNSVCCRSPIIPARPTYSGEMLGLSYGSGELDNATNIWTNPYNMT